MRLAEIVLDALPDGKWEYNVRPYWLTNPVTHAPLELDIYSEPYHLAFEYNGWQHSVVNEASGVTLQAVQSQRFRDGQKYRQVAARNIHLFIVTHDMMKSETDLWHRIMSWYRFSQTHKAEEAKLGMLHIVKPNGRTQAIIENPKVTIIPTAGPRDMFFASKKLQGEHKVGYNPTVKNNSLAYVRKH